MISARPTTMARSRPLQTAGITRDDWPPRTARQSLKFDPSRSPDLNPNVIVCGGEREG